MELTYSHAIDENIPIDQFPKFFEDARLNFAENMLCGDEDRLAIVDMDEQCLWTPRKYTWTQLRDLVSVYSSGIRAAGLRKGDAVTCTHSFIHSLGHSLWTLTSRSDRRKLCTFAGAPPRNCFCRMRIFLLCHRYWRKGTIFTQRLRQSIVPNRNLGIE